MKKTSEKKQNLEQGFAELEHLTEELQSDTLSLEDALVKFERGLTLAEQLRQRLGKIENKIETIRLKFKDTLADDKGEEE